MYPMSRAHMVAYRGVRTKNHMNPIPMTMPGKEKERKLNDSRMPEALDLTLTITYEMKMESKVPREAPTMQRNRLFFKDDSDIGSWNTFFQCTRLMLEKAFKLGTMEYGTKEVYSNTRIGNMIRMKEKMMRTINKGILAFLSGMTTGLNPRLETVTYFSLDRVIYR